MALTESTAYRAIPDRSHPFLSWGGIIAGCVAALAIHLLLTLLGMGLGLLAFDPGENDRPFLTVGVASGIIWSIAALISLWAGGWIAGRIAGNPDIKGGAIHGILVWSLATVVVFFTVFRSAGAVVGGAAGALGSAVSTATEAVAPAAASAAGGQSGGSQSSSPSGQSPMDALWAALSDAQLENPGQSAEQLSNAIEAARARSEAAAAFYPLLMKDAERRTPQDRQRAVDALTNNTQIPPADANRIVDQWIDLRDRTAAQTAEMADDAAEAATEAADAAASGVSKAAIWTFVAFVIGAFAAAWGGRVGATSVTKTETEVRPARGPVVR